MSRCFETEIVVLPNYYKDKRAEIEIKEISCVYLVLMKTQSIAVNLP